MWVRQLNFCPIVGAGLLTPCPPNRPNSLFPEGGGASSLSLSLSVQLSAIKESLQIWTTREREEFSNSAFNFDFGLPYFSQFQPNLRQTTTTNHV
jgi:hypothetical protein